MVSFGATHTYKMEGVRMGLFYLWLVGLLVSAPLAYGHTCVKSARASRYPARTIDEVDDEPTSGTTNNINKRNHSLRIYEGSYVRPGELPFLAHFKERTCAASIIDEHHLLTSAICTKDVDRNNFTVHVGCHKGNDGCVAHRVSKFIAHENFHGKDEYSNEPFNIAILRTEVAMKFGLKDGGVGSVYEIRLPNKEDGYLPGSDVSMAGWGGRIPPDDEALPKTNPPVIAPHVLVLDPSRCAKWIKRSGIVYLPDKQMCAMDNFGKVSQRTACGIGDIGGPLFGLRWGRPELAGILSSRWDCRYWPSEPNLYTRVSGFLDWIEWAKKEMANK